MIYPSQARKESMALAFAELDKVANPVICEVGRMRNPNAGESDGHSTLAFADYITTCNRGRLISVDKNEDTAEVCCLLLAKNGLGHSRVGFCNEDALVAFGLGSDEGRSWDPIDLLYLDGWDLNDPDSAKQHLLCFLLAEPFVKLGSLVLIDDTGYPDLGKGKLVVPVAELMGWPVLHKGFQTLLRKPI